MERVWRFPNKTNVLQKHFYQMQSVKTISCCSDLLSPERLAVSNVKIRRWACAFVHDISNNFDIVLYIGNSKMPLLPKKWMNWEKYFDSFSGLTFPSQSFSKSFSTEKSGTLLFTKVTKPFSCDVQCKAFLSKRFSQLEAICCSKLYCTANKLLMAIRDSHTTWSASFSVPLVQFFLPHKATEHLKQPLQKYLLLLQHYRLRVTSAILLWMMLQKMSKWSCGIAHLGGIDVIFREFSTEHLYTLLKGYFEAFETRENVMEGNWSRFCF